MEDNWKELNECLFNNMALQIHVDTRDFYCNFSFTEKEEIPDLCTMVKYRGAFFFTIQEVYKIVERLYRESGGKAGWRMLTFEQNGNWFKYLRIFKTDHGYVIGTNFGENCRFFKRSFWEDARIDKEHLCTH